MVRMYETGKTALEVTEELGGGQINDAGELERIASEVVAANPKQVEQYKSGKSALFGFFVGQVMKASQGKANPQVTNDLLKRLLG
jgi:aspartyl-tRNA(Asn)/glutamyl-tRNA(Gln) amidotransferase subunit B